VAARENPSARAHTHAYTLTRPYAHTTNNHPHTPAHNPSAHRPRSPPAPIAGPARRGWLVVGCQLAPSGRRARGWRRVAARPRAQQRPLRVTTTNPRTIKKKKSRVIGATGTCDKLLVCSPLSSSGASCCSSAFSSAVASARHRVPCWPSAECHSQTVSPLISLSSTRTHWQGSER